MAKATVNVSVTGVPLPATLAGVIRIGKFPFEVVDPVIRPDELADKPAGKPPTVAVIGASPENCS